VDQAQSAQISIITDIKCHSVVRYLIKMFAHLFSYVLWIIKFYFKIVKAFLKFCILSFQSYNTSSNVLLYMGAEHTRTTVQSFFKNRLILGVSKRTDTI
jgi:hypothetical protein